jgi:hypothetical protein
MAEPTPQPPAGPLPARIDDYGAWPETEGELVAYIRRELARIGDVPDVAGGYNLCPELMMNIAVAAFNYASGVLGVTGWQASWAELGFIRTTRHLTGPFAILDGSDLLYPQYDLRAKFEGYMREWPAQLADLARALLAESHEHAHPDVVARWQELAALAPPDPEGQVPS